MSTHRLAAIGSLLSDGTRAEILTVLMDGRAYTGGELAATVGVAASTASEHLTRLLDGGMVTVESQGRQRLFALAGPHVAELLEVIGAEMPDQPPVRLRVAPAGLAHARTCYDHLAGQVAVRIYESLLAAGHLTTDQGHVRLQPSGDELLDAIGVDVDSIRGGRRALVRTCLDWTQRRHHLAGAAGASLLTTLFDQGWVVRGPRPRSLRVTATGKRGLAAHFPEASHAREAQTRGNRTPV